MDDAELARLLSGRAEPSVLDKEQVLQRVLAETQRRPPRTRWLWAIPVVAAAAGLLLVLRPGPDRDRFAARGAGESQPALGVICVETGKRGACASGSTLAFDVDPRTFAYVALFARGADGRVIWYFPAAQGQSVALAQHQNEVLTQGVHLGAAQPPGDYEIVAVFSDRALDRSEIKHRAEHPEAGAGRVQVVRQPLVVEPAP